MSDAIAPSSSAAPPGRALRTWRTAWPWLFWALWGAWLADSDLRNDEVQPAVLLLLVGGAVLGAARPRRWWAWGLALAAWVPAEPLWARLRGLPYLWPANPGPLLAFIPGLAGAALGLALSRGMKRGDSAP